DALDHAADVLGKSGHHEARVAAGRRPGDAVGFEYGDRPAALGHFARDGQTGEPAADDADIDVEIEIEPPALRRGDARGLVPGRRKLGHSGVFLSGGAQRPHARLAQIRKRPSLLSREPGPPQPVIEPCAASSCFATPRPKLPLRARRTFPARWSSADARTPRASAPTWRRTRGRRIASWSRRRAARRRRGS